MTIEILVPDLPESVANATIIKWYKKIGDTIKRDEVLVEIETDKIVIEVPAVSDGILTEIMANVEDVVEAKQLLATIKAIDVQAETLLQNQEIPLDLSASKFASTAKQNQKQLFASSNQAQSPITRRLLAQNDLDASQVNGTGVDGRITREDVNVYLQSHNKEATDLQANTQLPVNTVRHATKKPMSGVRRTIAKRLLAAKNNTAMLTTFNEVNMQSIMELRAKYQEQFNTRHQVRLGFMSFYVKAVVKALKQYPAINAMIDGDDIIYYDYFDLNIAMAAPRGLITPIIQDCDQLSLAQIEKKIKELSSKAKDNKLTLEELSLGNFTITNGGVFGSLMSTPIINAPQTAILGMHKIQERPMAVNGRVVILPMMYLALSYDHRLIDGQEAIGFLVKVKELLEDPIRLLLDV